MTAPTPRRRRSWTYVLALICAALALFVVACGDDDDEPAAGGSSTTEAAAEATSDEPITIKMGVVPAETFAPIFVAENEGIWKKHNITVDAKVGGIANTLFPQLLKGQLDVVASAWGSLASAREQKLPLTGFAPIDINGSTLEDDYQQLVAPKGGVKDIKELEGKTIAVPALKSLTDSQVRVTLRKAGVDDSKVKFLQIPFPEMPAALKAGRVDAAAVVEPFLTSLKAQGANVLSATSQGVPMGAMIAAEKWVKENPDKVKRFQTAWKEALQFSIDNPDAVRKALSAFQIPEEAAQKVMLPNFTTELDPAEVQKVADLMKEAGALSQDVDMTKAITPFEPAS